MVATGVRTMTVDEFLALPVNRTHKIELARGIVMITGHPDCGVDLGQAMSVFHKRLLAEARSGLTTSAGAVVITDTPTQTQWLDAGWDVGLLVQVWPEPSSGRSPRLVEARARAVAHVWSIDLFEPGASVVFRLSGGDYVVDRCEAGVLDVDVPCRLTVDLGTLLP